MSKYSRVIQGDPISIPADLWNELQQVPDRLSRLEARSKKREFITPVEDNTFSNAANVHVKNVVYPFSPVVIKSSISLVASYSTTGGWSQSNGTFTPDDPILAGDAPFNLSVADYPNRFAMYWGISQEGTIYGEDDVVVQLTGLSWIVAKEGDSKFDDIIYLDEDGWRGAKAGSYGKIGARIVYRSDEYLNRGNKTRWYVAECGLHRSKYATRISGQLTSDGYTSDTSFTLDNLTPINGVLREDLVDAGELDAANPFKLPTLNETTTYDGFGNPVTSYEVNDNDIAIAEYMSYYDSATYANVEGWVITAFQQK
jgi:hypothetical protein|tara:strand:+ start:10279 stop:11217 length:939 start_codon:yes stop_codon:yes gene_type:complete